MKKNILVLLLLAISVSSFVGCNAKDTAVNNQDNSIVSSIEDENSKVEESLPTSDMSAKFVNCYKTLDEINNDSELVVMGRIIENGYVEYGGMTFTLSKFKIDKVVKGNVNVGDTIKVLQSGGISEVKSDETDVKSFEDTKEVEKYLKEKAGNKYESTIDGVKVLKENDSEVLLLQKYDGPITKDSYVGTGDLQGRFIVNKKTETVTAQSEFLTETVTLDDLMNLK